VKIKKKTYDAISNTEIWTAIRALGLMQKSDASLALVRDTHSISEMFASRVIVLAVDQVRALRAITQKGRAA
jgi:hypothetical protein